MVMLRLLLTAAEAEIEKILILSSELDVTVADLHIEAGHLTTEIEAITGKYNLVNESIRESISPDISLARAAFSELVEKKGEIRKVIDQYEKIQNLEAQKSKLLEEHVVVGPSDSSGTDLSKTILDELAQQIERLLKHWNFPDADRVYFDEKEVDFIIGGKPRASRGKGLRAITHAAVTIGLLEYCKDRGLPHPGFIVLDSPLLSYWGPEGDEDSLVGTDLKERFYEYLAMQHGDSQIIIIENEHPPEELLDRLAFTDFTKNPNHGRYGFFPHE